MKFVRLALPVFLASSALVFFFVFASAQSGSSCSSGLVIHPSYGCDPLQFSSWVDESTGGSSVDVCVLSPAGNLECEGNAYRSYEVAQARVDFSWSQFASSGSCQPVGLVIKNNYVLWEHPAINYVTFSFGGSYNATFYGGESALFIEDAYSFDFDSYGATYDHYIVLPAGVQIESFASYYFSTLGTTGIFGPRYIDYGFTFDAVGSSACVPTPTPSPSPVPPDTFPNAGFPSSCVITYTAGGVTTTQLVSSSVLYNGSFEERDPTTLRLHGWDNLNPEYPYLPPRFDLLPVSSSGYDGRYVAYYVREDAIACQFVNLPTSANTLLVGGYARPAEGFPPSAYFNIHVGGVVYTPTYIDGGSLDWTALISVPTNILGSASVCFSMDNVTYPSSMYLDAVWAIPYSDDNEDGFYDIVCPDPSLNPTPTYAPTSTPAPTPIPTSTPFPTLEPLATFELPSTVIPPVLDDPMVGLTPQPTSCPIFWTTREYSSGDISGTLPGVQVCIQNNLVSFSPDNPVSYALGSGGLESFLGLILTAGWVFVVIAMIKQR